MSWYCRLQNEPKRSADGLSNSCLVEFVRTSASALDVPLEHVEVDRMFNALLVRWRHWVLNQFGHTALLDRIGGRTQHCALLYRMEVCFSLCLDNKLQTYLPSNPSKGHRFFSSKFFFVENPMSKNSFGWWMQCTGFEIFALNFFVENLFRRKLFWLKINFRRKKFRRKKFSTKKIGVHERHRHILLPSINSSNM